MNVKKILAILLTAFSLQAFAQGSLVGTWLGGTSSLELTLEPTGEAVLDLLTQNAYMEGYWKQNGTTLTLNLGSGEINYTISNATANSFTLSGGDLGEPLHFTLESGISEPMTQANPLGTPSASTLTQEMLETYADFISYFYGLPFTKEDRAKAQAFVQKAWAENNTTMMQSVLTTLEVAQEFSQLTLEQQQERHMQMFPYVVVAAYDLAQQGDEESQWIVNYLEATYPGMISQVQQFVMQQDAAQTDTTGQTTAMLQNELNNMQNNMDIIMGKDMRFNPSSGYWEQTGGIDTDYE
jgi:hypothetical protein